MSEQRHFNACVRAVSFRVPLIRKHVSKAAHGRRRDARYQLDQAIRHSRDLLDELETERAVLGRRQEDVA
jgi:hypothetical protein